MGLLTVCLPSLPLQLLGAYFIKHTLIGPRCYFIRMRAFVPGYQDDLLGVLDTVTTVGVLPSTPPQFILGLLFLYIW
jgi:hypothetical protein